MLTADDLITRFGEAEIAEVSDHINHRDIDYQVVNKAVEDANELARGYYNAAGLIGVAFDAATIAKMADVAIYRLWENSASEIRIERYKDAIKWFEYLVNHPQMVLIADGEQKPAVSYTPMRRG